MCREGSRTGHWSFCPSSGAKLAIKTVCVFSSAPPGCCLPQHKAVTLRLSFSFPLSLAFLVHCDKHSPPFFCLRAAYNQHVPHALDKSRGSFSAGAGWQHQPCNPLFISSVHPPPHLSCAPVFSPPLAFSILSCRGKRWPEESNNCDSGAFWHCSWSCADTHRAVCSL